LKKRQEKENPAAEAKVKVSRVETTHRHEDVVIEVDDDEPHPLTRKKKEEASRPTVGYKVVVAETSRPTKSSQERKQPKDLKKQEPRVSSKGGSPESSNPKNPGLVVRRPEHPAPVRVMTSEDGMYFHYNDTLFRPTHLGTVEVEGSSEPLEMFGLPAGFNSPQYKTGPLERVNYMETKDAVVPCHSAARGGFIRHDGSTSPGDSGLPLMNSQRRVVGIHYGDDDTGVFRLAVAAPSGSLTQGLSVRASPPAPELDAEELASLDHYGWAVPMKGVLVTVHHVLHGGQASGDCPTPA
jgi:hypothetical protein